MAGLTQDNRAVKVFTALPENTLLFSSMSGTEKISSLFDYRLDLITENVEVDLDQILGTEITVQLELPASYHIAPGTYRYFHGVVSNCGQIAGSGEYMHYEFSVRPWLWFLTRTADCRIFQDESVPDIIEKVLQDAGFTDFELSLTGTYEVWRYCVQYRETDLNFISRLMEQEGIYYYFKHEKGKHTMMIVDGYGGHSTFPGYEDVPYYPASGNQLRERDHIHQWQLNKQLQPGKYATRDFNFETPKADLLSKKTIPGKHVKSDYEIYDYPGEYPGSDGVPKPATGDTVARVRMEEFAAQHEIAQGDGNAQGLVAGHLFKLSKFGINSQNAEYLITEANCSCNLDDYRSGATGEMNFFSSIKAVPSRSQYRAPRVTPKPFVQGPQTAIVVGKKGEEIWTDKYGRVKLQFHWDRYGKSDEKSSCWVRVSQAWAGQGWGSMHIPRIGHEVIVEFLEGDPDRPIITGRVYNGDNGVPYELPANQTQSGIKSRSTKKGAAANFNELRMEDKKGEEEFYMHAEKDMNVVVENDKTLRVGFDKSDKGDYTVDIKNHRTVTIDSGNDTLLVKSGDRDTTISKGDYSNTVEKGDHKTEVSSGDHILKVKTGDHDIKMDAGLSKIEAMKSITLKVGSNSIVIDQSGITIKGIKVKIQAQTTADVKGVITSIDGSAMVKVKGGVTMIN